MEIRGLDLNKRESQLSIKADDGTITDRRIATSRERFADVFGGRPPARILLEASPEGRQYPTIVASWECAWPYVTPFFVFPPAVRKLIYTRKAIESLHMRLRKIIKTRGHFPTDEAAFKLLWLAIQNATKDTVRSAHAWHEAMNQFAIFFGERFTHPQR